MVCTYVSTRVDEIEGAKRVGVPAVWLRICSYGSDLRKGGAGGRRKYQYDNRCVVQMQVSYAANGIGKQKGSVVYLAVGVFRTILYLNTYK